MTTIITPKIPTNQTIKDFSFGRKFVRGFASRSLLPLLLLEACVESGRTYQAYKRGGFTEARERITEEFIGACFWFSGFPLFNKLIDKHVGKKLLKLPETNFDTGKDELRNPVKNYINKFRNQLKNPDQAEKMIAKYKLGKIAVSILMANCLVGLVLPRFNQAITRHLLKKKGQEAPQTPQPFASQYTMDKFINKDKDKVSFGGLSTQSLMSLAYNFENNPKYGLVSTDVGVLIGRSASARNEYERNEIIFRDSASTYFYMFNMPLTAMFLNKLQDGRTSRLDPVAAKQVHDHMSAILKANGGEMKADVFREFVLGNPDGKSFITPSISKELREGKGVIELDKFINLLNEVKEKYPQIDRSKFENAARKMSELQPKLGGKAILSQVQVESIFRDGAIDIPEFLQNVFRCATSDQNLITGKVSSATFNDELSFVSSNTFTKTHENIQSYVESILKKAKDGKITESILKKVNRENYIKNAANWGIGFAISASFLSTFIPKIQYWITKKVTGSDEFPGTKNYSEKK